MRTLESIGAQRGAPPFAVLVVDNDTVNRDGVAAAGRFFADSPIAGLVLVAHNQGNCHAYNAGLWAALMHFPAMRTLAVIDDDEYAGPDWLCELHRTAHMTGADIVGGPQIPVFEGAESAGAERHPVFRPPYRRTGVVPILYSSGNALIARNVLETMPEPFLDPAFNFLGGGDSDFYRRCRNAGFSFAWSVEAAVQETTPARRVERGWLTARGLRNGAISAMLERRQTPGLLGHARVVGRSLALLGASPFRGLKLWKETGSFFAGLYHLHVAIGRFQAEFGQVNEQYRQPEQL